MSIEMPEELDQLVRHGSFAMDRVAIANFNRLDLTDSQRSTLELRAALEMMFANGLIKPVPFTEWPELVALDPPYELARGKETKS